MYKCKCIAVISLNVLVNGKCEICQTKAISFWCEECQQWMCDGCHIAHRRIPACRNHHMTPISAMNEEATKKIEENQGKLRDCMVDHQIIIRAVQDTIRQRNDQQTLSLQESDQLRNEVLKEINDYFDSLDKLLIKFIHKRVAYLNQQKEQLEARYSKLKECVISTNVILKENPKTVAFKESALVQEAEELLKSYATPDVRINNNILRLYKGPNWDVRNVAGLRKEEKPQTNSKDLIYHNRISSRDTIDHVNARDSRRPRTSHAQHGDSDSLRYERSRTNINPERSLESRRPPLPPRPNTSIATNREVHTRRESLDCLPSSSLNHENSRTCSVQ